MTIRQKAALPPCAAPHELLARFYGAAGDDAASDAAASALIACAQPDVRAYLAGQGARGDDLDDLCQQCRVRLLQALRASHAPGARPIENWTAFARTTARNLLTDSYRHRRARPPTASLEGLAERTGRAGEDGLNGALAAGPDDVAARVLSALSVERLRTQLWHEVCALPDAQRAALLLALERDELLMLQIKQTEIAKALGLSLSELMPLWSALPLADREIARRLGVANVSNLRKSARERLARRLARLDP